jgi:hypothetical protein
MIHAALATLAYLVGTYEVVSFTSKNIPSHTADIARHIRFTKPSLARVGSEPLQHANGLFNRVCEEDATHGCLTICEERNATHGC